MRNGFTLVETLVALFVFGLLAAASVVVLGGSADTQLRLREVTGELGDLQRLRAALRADLAQAAVRLPRGEAGERLPAFDAGDGQGRLFAFVRRGWENPDALPRASLQHVEYRLDGGDLVRLSRRMVDGAAYAEPAVLARGVEAVVVTYRDSEGVWRDSWDPVRSDAIPAAVQIDLTTRRFGTVRQLFLTQVPA
jgi:general secretion pathway protein J